MAIDYNQQTRQFHIYNDHISYIFYIMETGVLGHLYYGKRLPLHLDLRGQKSHMNHVLKVYTDDENLISYEDTLQELPIYGRGDYREEAIRLEYKDGSSLNQFTYTYHEVVEGIYESEFQKLPHAKPKNSKDATTLKVTLGDDYRHLVVELYYTIFEDMPVMTRHLRVTNHSDDSISLSKCMSGNLDFNESDFRLLQLDGAWARERHVSLRDLSEGRTSFGSIKGTSSANHNPFMALLKGDASENQGEVYSMNLVYSGNFEAVCEINTYKQLRAQIGINEKGFSWVLEKGQTFVSPEAVFTYSHRGLAGLSIVNHRFVREMILPADPRTDPQVLINTWEANYFDFDEASLLELAQASADYGINLFVLDDGWFSDRDNDEQALGDWFIDRRKLPRGLKVMSDKIHDLGMDFGLWIEPEMTNIKSQLYQEHPEWVVGHPSYSKSLGRHQLVLDYANPTVVDHIFNLLKDIFDYGGIDYIKWDMNRMISEPFGTWLGASHQGEFSHRYILGVYDLYDRIRNRYPNMVIEACASGGNRFDLGMLYYSHQAWTSDDTDPSERLRIQTGTSYMYPIKVMGSHVSAKVNHQTLRDTSYGYKSHVALFGTYGFELDLRYMGQSDKALLKDEIQLYKDIYPLIAEGDFYRVLSPFAKDKTNHNDLTCWMLVNKDQTEALVGVYQEMAKACPNIQRLYLKGLDPNKNYKELVTNRIYHGTELMEIGYVLDEFFTGIFSDDKVKDRVMEGASFGCGDFTSKVLRFKEV